MTNIKFYYMTAGQYADLVEEGKILAYALYFLDNGELYRGSTKVQGGSVLTGEVDSLSAACPQSLSAGVEGNVCIADVTGTDYKAIWIKGAEGWSRIDEAEKIDALAKKVDETTGNLSASLSSVTWDKVYLDEDFLLAGNYTVGNAKTVAGTTVTISCLNADGSKKSVKDAMQQIFTKELQPNNPTNPRVGVTTATSELEVGSTLTGKSYTGTWYDGSYTYGPSPTGAACSSITITAYNGKTATKDDGSTTVSVTADDKYIELPQAYEIARVTATNNLTNVKDAKTNIGKTSDPVKKITATTCSAATTSCTGFRKMFYGSTTSTSDSYVDQASDKKATTSANIRNLAGKEKASTGVKTLTVVEGARQVVFAVPAGRSITKVEDVGAFGTDIFTSFVKTEGVIVAGADNDVTKSAASAYSVYVYTPAAALGANTYKVTVA